MLVGAFIPSRLIAELLVSHNAVLLGNEAAHGVGDVVVGKELGPPTHIAPDRSGATVTPLGLERLG